MKQFSWEEFQRRGGTLEKCPLALETGAKVRFLVRVPFVKEGVRYSIALLTEGADTLLFYADDGTTYFSSKSKLMFAPRTQEFFVVYFEDIYGDTVVTSPYTTLRRAQASASMLRECGGKYVQVYPVTLTREDV